MKKSDIKEGMRVSCKTAVYCNPVVFFNPGDVGIVRGVDIPYVRRAATFVIVDFARNGKTERVGLEYDNITLSVR